MRNAIVLLGILAGCGEAPVHPAPPAPADQPPRIVFHGSVLTRNDDGDFKKVASFYEASNAIGGEPKALRRLLNDRPVNISLISAERDSAVIRVWYRDESREVTIRQQEMTSRDDLPAMNVQFDDAAVNLSIALGATTVTPIKSFDPILNEPATAHRLDPRVESQVTVSGNRILETRKMTSNQAQRVRAFLTGNGYLELEGADCFDPGMEIQYGQGDDAIHVVICLSCYKIRITKSDYKKLNLFYGLNKAGVDELKSLYSELF
jgi:hypothetical protein